MWILHAVATTWIGCSSYCRGGGKAPGGGEAVGLVFYRRAVRIFSSSSSMRRRDCRPTSARDGGGEGRWWGGSGWQRM